LHLDEQMHLIQGFAGFDGPAAFLDLWGGNAFCWSKMFSVST
jgi:hypothetical protein